jgi:uncharacterized protein
MTDRIELMLNKILQTKTYTAIVLGNSEKKFSIYMEPNVGQIAQEFFSNKPPERPKTFDFLSRCFLGLDLKVLRVTLYDIQNTTFYANILLEQQEDELIHLIEVDARPSDSILLALRYNAPIYCVRKVLSETVPYIEPID